MEKIYLSLDPKFEQIVLMIEETKYLETMKIEQLQESLQAYEYKWMNKKEIIDKFFN